MPNDVYTRRWMAAQSQTPTPSFRFGASDLSRIPPGVSRRIPPVMSPGQAYYWTPAWQVAERESVEALATGECRDFDSAEDVIRYLLSVDDE